MTEEALREIEKAVKVASRSHRNAWACAIITMLVAEVRRLQRGEKS